MASFRQTVGQATGATGATGAAGVTGATGSTAQIAMKSPALRVCDHLFFLRPLLHIPVWTISIFLNQRGGYKLFGWDFICILGALSSAVAGAYVINQIFDCKSDRVNAKLGFFEPPISFSARRAWIVYAVVNLGALVIGASVRASGAWTIIAVILLGIVYSAPPLRLKDRPVLDALTNALAYSVVIHLTILELTESARPWFWEVDVALFLAVFGIATLTTIPDIRGDSQVGKRSIAAVFGPALAGWVGALCFALSCYLGVRCGWPALWVSGAVALAPALISLRSADVRWTLIAIKAPILSLSGFAVWAEPVYGLFLIALVIVTRLYYKRRFGLVYPRIA